MPDQPLRHPAAQPVDFVLPNQSRRRFLSATVLAGSALFAASNSASAFSLFLGSIKLDTSNLPRDWVRNQGGELHAYANYLSSLRLRHIGVEEVIAAHAKTKGNLWNTLPSRALWKNMGQTLWVADEVAHRLGGSIKEVTSAYRSPSYNARCQGAKPNSFHKTNYALDLKYHASPSTVARIARSVREEGRYQGGIGRYSGFTHVDTRGYNVDW
mgnify:CR=1 FL=1